MSENKESKTQKNNPFSKFFNIAVAIAAAAFIGYMIVNNIATFLNIMKVVIGFGFVIMIDEFGHFIVAKLSGIKVNAFSIGFPPVLLGIRKTEKGTRLRVLPCLFAKKIKDGDKEVVNEESGVTYTIASKNPKPSDTEYQIGLIPAGGFVAMMGQSDSGAVEKTDDPRSFANKSISIKIAVVAAGVIFNAISAVFIFMTVFSIGLDLPPAVVGDVLRNSPAEKAGLVPGDRIISVNGETFVDFTSIPMAAALSDKGEAINLIVKRADGSEGPYEVIAKEPQNMPLPLRKLGIAQAMTIALPDEDDFMPGEAEALLETTGFKPGDIVTAVDGTDVEHAWEMNSIIRKSVKPTANLTVKHVSGDSSEIEVPLYITPNVYNFDTSFDIAHFYSLVPRLKIDYVIDRTAATSWQDKVKNFWRKTVLRQAEALAEASPLKTGDIIVNIAGTDNPTYPQMRDITKEHKNKAMPMTVLRKNDDGVLESVDVEVFPLQKMTRTGDGPVNIGIIPVLDIENAVVANTTDINEDTPALNIPAGATITKINGTDVSNYYQIVNTFGSKQGENVKITYLRDDETETVNVTIPTGDNLVMAESDIAVGIPFKSLKEIYKAENPIEGIQMGLKKTSMFITQTLMTIKGLFTKSVSPTTLSGPLGIVTTSYAIAKQSTMYYLYFLGLISSCIAVMNLLPLPIVDGGVIVLLIIEKIKGSPISEKVQEVISYAGLALILALFAWLFWNDALNMILRPGG